MILNIKRIILIAAWLLVVLSFITTQLTNDFFVFWAYGRFVANSQLTGLAALIETWELKGLLFKLYLYIEYALTSQFSTLFDAYGQAVYKTFGILPYLLILFLSIFLLPTKFIIRYRKIDIFFASSILLLAVHFASHFQAEMWGVLLLLLSFSIYLHDGWKSKVISAIVFSLTFYLKSPIPLLGGSLVATSVILKKQNVKKGLQDVIPFALTTILFISASLSLVNIYLHQEIEDIWNASYYQHTLLHDGFILNSFITLIFNFFSNLLYYPIVFIGSLAVLHLFIIFVKQKCFVKIIYLLLIWLFPLMYVLISNCFFVYHYYLLSFSSLLTLLVFLNTKFTYRKVLFNTISIILLGYYLFALSSVSPTNIYYRNEYEKYSKMNMHKLGIYPGCSLGNQSIMFLDGGFGAFYFSNSSYLRYFYPLPLQRTSSSDEFAKSSLYQKEKRKALLYGGDYITLDEKWFSRGNNEDILKKIEREYELLEEISICTYPWTLFKKESGLRKLQIYKKIEM